MISGKYSDKDYKIPISRPPLKETHKEKRIAWSEKCMKTNFKHVLFTDEVLSNTVVNGSDGWAKESSRLPSVEHLPTQCAISLLKYDIY